MALGAPSLAALAFRDAVRIEPRLAPAHFALGDALGRRGHWAQAAASYGAAARLRKDAEYQGNLVHALGRAFLWRDALAACDGFGELLAEDADVLLVRGLILRRLGRPNEAILAFRRAAQRPAAPASRRFFLGEALFGGEAWRGAQAALTQAQGIGPRESWGSRLNAAPARLEPAASRTEHVLRKGRLGRWAPRLRRAGSAGIRAPWRWGKAFGRSCRFSGLSLVRILFRQPHHALRAVRAAHGREGAHDFSGARRPAHT
jgi:tetratricopeptide (TPR) repeat protein